MLPRVTAILVAPGDPGRFEATRSALDASEPRPERIVQIPDWDATAQLPPPAADEWLWFLTPQTVPLTGALGRLLAAVDVSPSVVIAGPKLVAAGDADRILSFGESMSRYGATVPLVEDELDQAQHDRSPDVLAVAREGALVRRDVFQALGGFDTGLPRVDAGLELSVRARLAGHRVVRVADARVSRLQRPEDTGLSRPAPERMRFRMARRAQLHRRLVWAPTVALPLHWLALVPLGIFRAVGRLVLKRPELMGAELAAALMAAVDRTVPAARSRLRRSRRLGWAAIAPLRVPPDELRRRRAAERERRAELRGVDLEIRRARFVPGGFSVVLAMAAVSLGVNWRLLGAAELGGGALRRLAETPGQLWAAVAGSTAPGSTGWQPADPFTGLLATLGSLSFWDPSFALVLLWLIAMPLAALGAWWCATRISEHAGPPVIAAIAWSLAPPLLVALADGRPGAVISHLLLPWLLLAALDAGRSWTAAAGAALLFAATVAASPSLAPALLLLHVVGGVLRPRSIVRTLVIPLLGLAALAPVAIAQFRRGTPLGILGDPGVPLPVERPRGWELLLGIPRHGADSWGGLLGGLFPDPTGVIIAGIVVVPLGALALLAVFLPRSARAIGGLGVACAGLGTAVGAAQLVVGAAGMGVLGPWPGAGLSLYWFGLVIAAIACLDTLHRPAAVLSTVLGTVLVVSAAAAVVPVIVTIATGGSAVVGNARVLPAIVEAEAVATPELGTLVLTAQDDGSIRAQVERGAGTTLESFSSLDSALPALNESLATVAGNLASFGAADATETFQRVGIHFVLAPSTSGPATATTQRIVESLDASSQLQAVGETEVGVLWRTSAGPGDAPEAAPPGPIALSILSVLCALLAATVLLALPTGPRRRVVDAASRPGDDPADTFDEDDNA